MAFKKVKKVFLYGVKDVCIQIVRSDLESAQNRCKNSRHIVVARSNSALLGLSKAIFGVRSDLNRNLILMLDSESAQKLV